MSEAKYLIIGDLHGDLHSAIEYMGAAKDLGASELVQVGDWSFLWPGSGGPGRLVRELEQRELTMRFIDGNHDWIPELQGRTALGEFDKTLIYQPRGSMWTTPSGTTVGFLGGAVSIDKAWRKEGKSWWPEEEITQTQADMLTARGHLDVLVTHDSPILPPGLPPPPMEMSPTMVEDCGRNRDKVAHAVRSCTPRRLFHGHYHYAKQYTFEETTCYALSHNCNYGSAYLVDSSFAPIDEQV